jgi:N-acetylmuramoyl-L-alanine amidase
MNKFIYCIDAGHGGMIDGEYVTAPSKMYTFDDGFVIHEGVQNRIIARKLCDMLAEANVEHVFLTNTEEDMPLKERVNRVDQIHAETGKAFLISIHLNAGGGKGFEVFTSIGQTESDRLADFFYTSFEEGYKDVGLPGRRDLTDGDNDKEAQFYVLRKSDCPAILTENGFMDNRKEAEWLCSEEGTYTVAKAHFDAIMMIEKIYSK